MPRALSLQLALAYRPPHQWRGPSVRADQVQRQGRLVIGVEVRPVQRHQRFFSLGEHVRHPGVKQIPHLDPGVAQQPVHLLDGVLLPQPAGFGEPDPDRVHAEAPLGQRSDRRAGQRLDALCVQVLLEEILELRLDDSHQPCQPLRPFRSGHPPTMIPGPDIPCRRPMLRQVQMRGSLRGGTA